MKTKIVILIVSVLFYNLSYSQVLNQDAKGNSSILFNGSTLGVDIQDASISCALNNFRNQHIADSSNKLMYGFNLKAKNNDGVAELFTQGSFNPESKIIGIIGRSWYSDNDLYFQKTNKTLRSKINELENLTQNFVKNINGIIDTIKVVKDSNETELKELKEELKNLIESVALEDLSNKMLSVATKYKTYKKIIESVSLTTKLKYLQYLGTKQDLENEVKSLESEFVSLRKYGYKRVTYYITGGINSSIFKLQNTIDTSNFSNSFKNQEYYGYDFKLGMNCQFGGEWILGTSIGIQKNNTQDNLTKKEYTLRTVTSNSSQQLISEKKITAFAGDYKTFQQAKIEADVVRFIKAGKDIVALDLYLRQFFPINNTISTDITNIGISTYFFKNTGNFIGGIYIEFPDVFNNIDRGKGSNELKPFERRISFGLVAKISLNSLSVY